ncbi:intraflagellar transport-associated protein [Heptranchias perlo]|uniref:intraflagellar transport-associated protein n=1 Tax=Heptranchias perlo TaxID=212740 RepID=UPI00355A2E0B
MEEEGIIYDALEKFCSSHEQTYDEFLGLFLHLRKEDLKKQKASPPEVGSIADDTGNNLVQREVSTNSIQKGGELPKDDEEANNYIDFEDIDNKKETEQQRDTGLEVLPGEIEEETPADYSHYVCKHTSLDFKVNPDVQEFNNKTHDQVLTDEVQPFTMDEDFDYDCVYLKPKYTEAELKTISALSKQQKESGEFNAAELKDSDS